nr:B155 [uncultured bacterium]ART41074.1 L563 [uncultured bacterium]
MVNRKVRVKEQYFKFRVELQERFENIVFVPCSSLSNPIFWIFERPKYIVKMNDYAIVEPWQDVS